MTYVCNITAEPSPSPIEACTVLAGPPLPLPNVCTLLMTPIIDHQLSLWLFTKK